MLKDYNIFFYKYDFNDTDELTLKNELLLYRPEYINYMYNPDTLEPVYWFKPSRNLLYQMELRFCTECYIVVS